MDALAFCLSVSRAHGCLSLRLEDKLGAFHGLNYDDFTLLYLLGSTSDGRMPMVKLARMLGMSISALTRKMVLLEKTGLATREPACVGQTGRHAVVEPGGKRLMQEATSTAAALCAEALHSIDPVRMSEIQHALSVICGDELPPT